VAGNKSAAALDIRRLSKRFGGAVALDNVSLSIARGEVHGLLGSNGSGKSTLIKVLSGYHTPEPGAELSLYGHALDLPIKSSKLRELGLSFVHQHLGLVPGLSVTENLYLGKLASEDNWCINWTAAHENAYDVFERFDLELDPEMQVAFLSPVQQALLAIVRAYESLQESRSQQSDSGAGHAKADRPGVLVLDEPTPFLPKSGVEQLFQLVRQCVAGGSSVIFVSHDVDEVREITDRATILRDGKLIDTVVSNNISHEAFVSRIIGRTLEDYAGARKQRPVGAAKLHVENACLGSVGPLAFDIVEGEIVGLTGLIGSGFDSVPSLLYGAQPAATGNVTVTGKARASTAAGQAAVATSGQMTLDLSLLKPEQALQAGIAYLPADRLGEAGVGSLSVGDNVALPVLDKLKSKLGLTESQVQSHAAALGARADVKPNIPQLPLAALSGGNAQKALMAKWLQIQPQVLLLDEPTQGVDVGARQQLWDALDQTAAGGTAILIASTDYEQLASVCHRVLIFSQGQIVATLTGNDLSKDLIAEYCYRSMTHSA